MKENLKGLLMHTSFGASTASIASQYFNWGEPVIMGIAGATGGAIGYGISKGVDKVRTDNEDSKPSDTESIRKEAGENELAILVEIPGIDTAMELTEEHEWKTMFTPYRPYFSQAGEGKLDKETGKETLEYVEAVIDSYEGALIEDEIIAYFYYDTEEEEITEFVWVSPILENLEKQEKQHKRWQVALQYLWGLDKIIYRLDLWDIPGAKRYHDWLWQLDMEKGPYLGSKRICPYCGEKHATEYRQNPDQPMPEDQPHMVGTCKVCDEWIRESKKRMFEHSLNQVKKQ